MCGIWAVFGAEFPNLSCLCQYFSQISHRGPDAFMFQYDDKIKNTFLGFHRLAIVDGLCGMQPMKLYAYPKFVLLCNGEIYNTQSLKDDYSFEYSTKCDIEVIIHLYARTLRKDLEAEEITKSLDGVFAFCIVDLENGKVILGRDPFGVRPMFRLRSKQGHLAVCSEAKGLVGIKNSIDADWTLEPFPPSCVEVYTIDKNGKTSLERHMRYYHPGDHVTFTPAIPWSTLDSYDTLQSIRETFIAAVKKRLQSERRIGCLLSGGLDSSLAAAVLAKLAEDPANGIDFKIQTFAIGMDTSPDVVAARMVADHIKTEHHEILLKPSEIPEILDDLIYQLETFDITTIRASIGMYLLSRYIKQNTESTIVFSGEGADEVAQGYIYFRDAPSAEEAHKESVRLLEDIYLFDGLRADRTTSAFSLELRVPFLDLQFVKNYLEKDPVSRQPKNGVEKHLLRSAFNETGLLPQEILWRNKEAFSDGVASVKKSLFTYVQEFVECHVTDEDLKTAGEKYPHCTPKTKEAFYYRKVFEKHYAGQGKHFTPYFWMPRWVDGITDPSARFITHYNAGDSVTNGHSQ